MATAVHRSRSLTRFEKRRNGHPAEHHHKHERRRRRDSTGPTREHGVDDSEYHSMDSTLSAHGPLHDRFGSVEVEDGELDDDDDDEEEEGANQSAANTVNRNTIARDGTEAALGDFSRHCRRPLYTQRHVSQDRSLHSLQTALTANTGTVGNDCRRSRSRFSRGTTRTENGDGTTQQTCQEQRRHGDERRERPGPHQVQLIENPDTDVSPTEVDQSASPSTSAATVTAANDAASRKRVRPHTDIDATSEQRSSGKLGHALPNTGMLEPEPRHRRWRQQPQFENLSFRRHPHHQQRTGCTVVQNKPSHSHVQTNTDSRGGTTAATAPATARSTRGAVVHGGGTEQSTTRFRPETHPSRPSCFQPIGKAEDRSNRHHDDSRRSHSPTVPLQVHSDTSNFEYNSSNRHAVPGTGTQPLGGSDNGSLPESHRRRLFSERISMCRNFSIKTEGCSTGNSLHAFDATQSQRRFDAGGRHNRRSPPADPSLRDGKEGTMHTDRGTLESGPHRSHNLDRNHCRADHNPGVCRGSGSRWYSNDARRPSASSTRPSFGHQRPSTVNGHAQYGNFRKDVGHVRRDGPFVGRALRNDERPHDGPHARNFGMPPGRSPSMDRDRLCDRELQSRRSLSPSRNRPQISINTQRGHSCVSGTRPNTGHGLGQQFRRWDNPHDARKPRDRGVPDRHVDRPFDDRSKQNFGLRHRYSEPLRPNHRGYRHDSSRSGLAGRFEPGPAAKNSLPNFFDEQHDKLSLRGANSGMEDRRVSCGQLNRCKNIQSSDRLGPCIDLPYHAPEESRHRQRQPDDSRRCEKSFSGALPKPQRNQTEVVGDVHGGHVDHCSDKLCQQSKDKISMPSRTVSMERKRPADSDHVQSVALSVHSERNATHHEQTAVPPLKRRCNAEHWDGQGRGCSDAPSVTSVGVGLASLPNRHQAIDRDVYTAPTQSAPVVTAAISTPALDKSNTEQSSGLREPDAAAMQTKPAAVTIAATVASRPSGTNTTMPAESGKDNSMSIAMRWLKPKMRAPLKKRAPRLAGAQFSSVTTSSAPAKTRQGGTCSDLSASQSDVPSMTPRTTPSPPHVPSSLPSSSNAGPVAHSVNRAVTDSEGGSTLSSIRDIVDLQDTKQHTFRVPRAIVTRKAATEDDSTKLGALFASASPDATTEDSLTACTTVGYARSSLQQQQIPKIIVRRDTRTDSTPKPSYRISVTGTGNRSCPGETPTGMSMEDDEDGTDGIDSVVSSSSFVSSASSDSSDSDTDEEELMNWASKMFGITPPPKIAHKKGSTTPSAEPMYAAANDNDNDDDDDDDGSEGPDDGTSPGIETTHDTASAATTPSSHRPDVYEGDKEDDHGCDDEDARPTARPTHQRGIRSPHLRISLKKLKRESESSLEHRAPLGGGTAVNCVDDKTKSMRVGTVGAVEKNTKVTSNGPAATAIERTSRPYGAAATARSAVEKHGRMKTKKKKKLKKFRKTGMSEARMERYNREREERKRIKESAKPLTMEQVREILAEDLRDCGGNSEGGNWVRRSMRNPSRGLLNTPQMKAFIEKVRSNHPEIVVLKMKKYINDPNAGTALLDAALDALEENSNCEALYIQNFNLGMRDKQLLHLLKILQQPTCRIWCINVGELYNIKNRTWERFTKGLKKTKVTHMYASEHTITSEMKDEIRATIRNNRSKHDMHINPNNLDVIIQCTHCWWNPINAKALRPYIRNRGIEHILSDREVQGLRGSTSAAPTV